MGKLTYGIGFIGDGVYSKKLNYAEYENWRQMLRRCYSIKFQEKWKTYIGCSVYEEWHNFQNFAEWCQTQVGFGKVGYHLDKDLLVKGNRVYSPKTCCFLPAHINTLIVKCNVTRGKYPIGVHWHTQRKCFVARCQDKSGKGSKHLGVYDNPDDAFKAYKIFKENLCKRVADEYVDCISNKVYTALANYKVDKDD